MLNFDGNFIEKSALNLGYNNRAFTYGDALFETMKFQNKSIQFFEDHYFRLLASMRMLRMEIPNYFTLEYLENQIKKTIAINDLSNLVRIKIQVFRKFGGLYLPKTNAIHFLIEVSDLKINISDKLEIDLFKDYFIHSGILSTLKTTNRVVNVLSSIFAKENNLENCVLLNEKKNVVEVNNGNLFIIKGNEIKTPSIKDGCIKGILRKKLIEMLEKTNDFTILETEISPFELQKSDAIFITNSIIGIQAVTKYRKKEFDPTIIKKIKNQFNDYYS